MVENLRLTGARKLTSLDSNVSSDWNLPAQNSSFLTSCVDVAYNIASGNSSYGSYYNWYAATAGTGNCSKSSGNANSSICPRGWHLPSSGASREFPVLYSLYSSSSLMQGAPGFVLSGRRIYSGNDLQGTDAYYWSSTAYSSEGTYYLYLSSTTVAPSSTWNKARYDGYTVRCVSD